MPTPTLHPPSTPTRAGATQVAGAKAGRRAEAQRHWQRGVDLKAHGRFDAALAAFRQAVALDASDSVYWINLAHMLAHAQDPEGTVAAARRALQLDSRSSVACALAADQLLAMHRCEEAVAQWDGLPADVPRGRDDLLRLALALLGCRQPQRAVDVLLTAIGHDLAHAESHQMLGIAFGELRMFEEAAEAHRTAWLLAPQRWEALALSLHRKQHACQWSGFEEDCAALEQACASGQVALDVPFALMSLPLQPMALRRVAAAKATAIQQAVAAAGSRMSTRPGTPTAGTHGHGVPAARPADGRLRVGYVSNDFHHHATAQLIVEMLEKHDRTACDVTLYAHDNDDGTPMRRRLEAACERFVDIAHTSDDQAAARIRADGIDILVDLKGYTSGQRLGIFARRPAALQVGFLGYPGTTGSDFIDYFIGDPVTTPPEAAEHFSEKLAQMPRCYQPNDSQRILPAPLPRSACGLPEDAFVMASFNQNYKITPAVFDTWCQLLHERPDAILWLLECDPQSTRNLRREAERRGIAAGRLIFAPPLPLEKHLARLPAADLFVDTTPCGAHTTASDALWAGLPLVTVLGPTFQARVAASLLHAQGVPELVATDLDHYADIVRALAADRVQLRSLRTRLGEARSSSGLFDGRHFARELETLFRRMAERAWAGLPPEHLWAAPAKP